MTALDVLYQDPWYVAVDKPAGMVVHRNGMPNQGPPVLQRLRDQIGRRLYPVHRLDQPTSGVLVFALSPEAARHLCARFTGRKVEKRYLAVVRGFAPEQERIDYPLRETEHLPARPAVTELHRLATVELPIPVGRYQTARYSLVEARPLTGRHHQIRKHLHHISHHVIGDTTHGDGRHNRVFRRLFDCRRLLLFATHLRFEHPYLGLPLTLTAQPPAEAVALFARLGWSRTPGADAQPARGETCPEPVGFVSGSGSA